MGKQQKNTKRQIYLSIVSDASFPQSNGHGRRASTFQSHTFLLLVCSILPFLSVILSFMHSTLSYNGFFSSPRTLNFTQKLDKFSILHPLQITKLSRSISLHPFYYITLHFTSSLDTYVNHVLIVLILIFSCCMLHSNT